jgi:hypothetical protein
LWIVRATERDEQVSMKYTGFDVAEYTLDLGGRRRG